MSEELEGVKLEGQNQAVASPEQQTDPDMSQIQGDVNDPERIKNRNIELEKKLEKANQDIELLKNVFSQQQQQQQYLQSLQQKPPEINEAEQRRHDLQLLNISEEALRELEETSPEGKVKAMQLRNDRFLAAQRQRDYEEKQTDERVIRRLKAEQYEEKARAEYPEAFIPNTPQFAALQAEYNRLFNPTATRQHIDIVYEAAEAAVRKNPHLFSQKTSARQIIPTRTDNLVNHTMGTTSPAAKPQIKKPQLSQVAQTVTAAFGNDPEKIAKRMQNLNISVR